jgi:hypothetical protein
MIKYAELDDNNKVVNIIIATESHISSIPGRFVNGQQVENFDAVIGSTYEEGSKKFIKEQPYPSWTLDEFGDWNAPVPRVAGDGLQMWDEDSLSWIALEEVNIEL